MKDSIDQTTLFSDILALFENKIPKELTQAVLDLVITSPYSSGIPIPLGFQILNTIKDSRDFSEDQLSAILYAVLDTNPGGLWFLLDPYFQNTHSGQRALYHLALLIPEEQWVLHQLDPIRIFLQNTQQQQERNSNADRD